jgi:hypothetical protein
MGFIEKWLFKNPTKNWEKKIIPDLIFDFNNFSLNDVKIFSNINDLSFLGFIENTQDSLIYKDQGLIIEYYENNISCFVLLNNSEEGKPFNGKIIIKNNFINIADLNNLENIIKYFGDPFWKTNNENVISLYYEYKNNIEVTFDLVDEKLEEIDISTPILADKKQRSYVGLKKWPPDFD